MKSNIKMQHSSDSSNTSLLQVGQQILAFHHIGNTFLTPEKKKVVPAILPPILPIQGATSHKFVDPTGNYWMHLYYTDRQT